MPCSPLKVNRHFGGSCYLFQASFFLGLSFALKMEAACSFTVTEGFQRNSRLYIPEDRIMKRMTKILIFRLLYHFPDDGGSVFLQIHDNVVTQKTIIVIFTTAKFFSWRLRKYICPLLTRLYDAIIQKIKICTLWFLLYFANSKMITFLLWYIEVCQYKHF
jgi:hypothetical protein